MKRREAGFTLTELMIVVAIIGICVGMAMVWLKPKIKPIDTSTRVGDLIREGNRRAVALGPVRANVATATGITYRTRITATAGPQPTFILERLLEDSPTTAATATWVEVQRYTVDKAVTAESFALAVGSHAALTLNTNLAAFQVHCYPIGKCDAATVFFQASASAPQRDLQSRLSIMPLGGSIYTRTDWN